MAVKKMNLNIFRAIGTLCEYLDTGWSIEEIKKKTWIKDEQIADLETIYQSSDYQNFLSLRSGQLEKDHEKIIDASWLVWGDPLTLLKERIHDGEIYMFCEEHTSYLSDITNYMLAPLKTICKNCWTEYDQELSQEDLLDSIRKNMIYKGIKTVRNLNIMSSQEGYAQYIKDFANSSRSRLVKLRTEFNGRDCSVQAVCQNFHLAPISGRDTGLNGMVYVESKGLHEVGMRNYPYLYYVYDGDVAELSLENEPRAVRGKIKDEEFTSLIGWVKINKKAIAKRWNHAPVFYGMPYESIEFLRSAKNINGEYIIGKNKKKRYNGLSHCSYLGITSDFLLMKYLKNNTLHLW